MRFRKNFFLVLAVLAAGWILYGFSVTSSAVQSVSQSADATYEAGSVERLSSNIGVGVGAGLSITVFLCTGLPLFFLFALLSWRNGVGLRNERRHQETIAALQQSKQ